ncbi:MAG: hypothetical protein AMK69_22905 [Nitrospira bacterium SG8_3]|nr:MAG: hypothetical protein AMK69_22905 [Nitrospira bacterium SG8_3]
MAQRLEKSLVISYFTWDPGVSNKVMEEREGTGLLFYPQPSRAVNGLAGLVAYGKILRERYP